MGCKREGGVALMFTKGNRRASKLTGENVQEIRALYTQVGVTQGMLARQFGVSRNTIANIVNWETWQNMSQGPVDNHPPPNMQPPRVDAAVLEASIARMRALMAKAQPADAGGHSDVAGGYSVVAAPSLYNDPPPADAEAEAAAQRAQVRLESEIAARGEGQVDAGLSELMGGNTKETDT